MQNKFTEDNMAIQISLDLKPHQMKLVGFVKPFISTDKGVKFSVFAHDTGKAEIDIDVQAGTLEGSQAIRLFDAHKLAIKKAHEYAAMADELRELGNIKDALNSIQMDDPLMKEKYLQYCSLVPVVEHPGNDLTILAFLLTHPITSYAYRAAIGGADSTSEKRFLKQVVALFNARMPSYLDSELANCRNDNERFIAACQYFYENK